MLQYIAHMLFAILGRQARLSLAELESYFGSKQVEKFGEISALIKSEQASVDSFGGTLKLAQLEQKFYSKSPLEVLKKTVAHFSENIPKDIGKITIGLSYYGGKIPSKILNQAGLKLKSQLKKAGVSVRLIDSKDLALSTATSHHNGLGKSPKKIEIIIVQNHQEFIVGQSIGCQNISAYRDRDQKRPKRDSKVGMLPPKLAQIIINLSRPETAETGKQLTLLDPFCGTGVILQEASLLGFDLLGSDIEPRMIDFTKHNLTWLNPELRPKLSVGDATKLKWTNFDCVASEAYLGRPYATPPNTEQLVKEKNYVGGIVKGFLKNIAEQMPENSQICLAVPAWLRPSGIYDDLDIIKATNLAKLGLEYKKFRLVKPEDLLYFRPDQSVARRLLVLVKKSSNQD